MLSRGVFAGSHFPRHPHNPPHVIPATQPRHPCTLAPPPLPHHPDSRLRGNDGRGEGHGVMGAGYGVGRSRGDSRLRGNDEEGAGMVGWGM